MSRRQDLTWVVRPSLPCAPFSAPLASTPSLDIWTLTCSPGGRERVCTHAGAFLGRPLPGPRQTTLQPKLSVGKGDSGGVLARRSVGLSRGTPSVTG